VSREHQLVPATEAHARALAPRLRAEDAAEVQATAGVGPLEGLLMSLRGTLAGGGHAEAWLVGGEVAALWGVRPLTGLRQTGVVWLLTGELVERHRIRFGDMSLGRIGELLLEYSVLINWIDARYRRALRWAEWTGAELQEPRPFGAEARDFVKAVWRRAPRGS